MEPDTTGRRIALATVRMEQHGHAKAFTVEVPLGPSRLLDVLSATYEIANQEAQANIDRSRADGKDISCRAGCGACCRQIVAISAVEAQSLRELVDRMPEEHREAIRARFAAGIRALEDGGLLDAAAPPGQRYPLARPMGSTAATLNDLGLRYFRLGIACPFLEDESCGIYEHRPAVCRQYHVTSPAENCSRAFEATIDRLEPGFHGSKILGELTETVMDLEHSTLMLIQALEWSHANGSSMQRTGDGEQLFGLLMRLLSQPAG